jgi:hypothetical protein
MTMIATVIRQFWIPIVVVIAIGIYFIRAARRLDSLDAVDEKVINPEPVASGPTSTPRSVAAGIIMVMFGFAILASLQYSRRMALVHPTTIDYLLVAIIAGALVFAFVRLREGLGVSAGRRYQAVSWFLVAAIGVRGALLLANAVLDPGPAREFTTVVDSQYCGGRNPDITLRGAPVLPVVASTMRINVRSSMCHAARAGDTVIVLIGPGYFGRPWVQGARPVQTARQ